MPFSYLVAFFQSITPDTTRQNSNRLIALLLCSSRKRRTMIRHQLGCLRGEFTQLIE